MKSCIDVSREAKEREKQHVLWEVMSYTWADSTLTEQELRTYSRALRKVFSSWKDINRVATTDICGAFAVDSFLIFPCMFWFIMPDWQYDTEYLKQRRCRWYARPKWLYFCNPFRVLGYPIALLMSWPARRKLKAAFERYEL